MSLHSGVNTCVPLKSFLMFFILLRKNPTKLQLVVGLMWILVVGLFILVSYFCDYFV